VGSDREVFITAAACRLFGVEPGRDLVIVGYDNYWRRCMERQYEPYIPAATVDKHNEKMGGELVRLLLDRVADRLPPEPQTRVIPPQLVITSTSEETDGGPLCSGA
jgi:DNA-binding LacI/PurR family transcriptional regulator